MKNKIQFLLCLLVILFNTWSEDITPQNVAVKPSINKDPTSYGNQSKEENEVKRLLLHVSTLYDIALQDNITVNPSEVNEYINLYKEAYPNLTLNTKDVEKAIAVEKFIRQKYNIFYISKDAIQEKYAIYKENRVNQSIPDIERITPIFESLIVLKDQNVENEINKKREKRMKKRMEIAAKYDKFWSPEQLYISGHPDECIAYGYDTCFFTLSMYNECVPFIKIPLSIPQDSIHQAAFYKILSTLKKVQLAKESGFANTTECKETINNALKTISLHQRYSTYKFLGRPNSLDESDLYETYGLYYNKYFSEREDISIGVIGSSDSLLVDSLYTVLILNHKKNSTSSNENTDLTNAFASLPWTITNLNDLPSDIIEILDTLRSEGDFTRPVNTRYGHFIFKLHKIAFYKEIPFEKAYDKLVMLTLKERNEALSGKGSNKNYQYYLNNIDDFYSPDTLKVRLWLAPYGKNINWTDTSNNKPLTTLSTNLPYEISNYLYKNVSDTLIDSCIGPNSSIYGTWLFKIVDKKCGGKKIRYSEVKDIIKKRREKEEDKIDLSIFNDNKNWYLPLIALAKTYDNHLASSYRKVSNESINKLIKRGEMDVPKKIDPLQLKKGNSKEAEFEYIKDYIYPRYMREKLKQSINEWIARISLYSQIEQYNYSKK